MSPLHGDTPLVSAAERPPRLVLLFAIFTALGVAAAGAVILVVIRHTDAAQAQRQAIDRAQFVAQAVLRPELRAADLSGRLGQKRRGELDRALAARVLLDGIRGVTLYGRDGRAVYSTAGGPGIATSRVSDALSGSVVAEVDIVNGSNVHRTYMPVAAGGGSAGVVRLDQEFDPITAAVHRPSWLIAGVLWALLFLLFLVFVPILARVSSRIRGQFEELDRIATHDHLTDLPNRLAVRRAAEQMFASSGSGALVLLDLDGFSEINDSLGARSGDDLLVQVAERLRYELDDHDFFARLGEDEFAILLHGAEHAKIEDLADTVDLALASPFVVDGVRVAVSARIGAALAEPGSNFATVLTRAGAALRAAKKEGQRSPQIAGPEHELHDVSRLAIIAELREAIEGGELVVYYQPQSDLTTRRIRGVEALLRWEHPNDGLLPAADFISYVERGGLVTEIRRFVLESAVSQWQEWHELGLDLELAVNLSAVDVLDVALPGEVSALLDSYGMPPRRLILELTERTLIADERRATRVIEQLTRLGVRIAVDDFGTGYSSLSSLHRFPVHQVKLDRSLLVDVPGDAAAEAIIGGCVEIAHGAGATVVAEGIETSEQWRFVSLMGCDIAQGYKVGRPVPADELTPLLNVPNHVPLTAV